MQERKPTSEGQAPRGAIEALLERRFRRRDVLIGGGMLAAASATGCTPARSEAVPLATIAGSSEDRVVVPNGFASDVLIRWGDPVVAGAAPLPLDGLVSGSLLGPGIAALQSGAFGTSCDGMGVIALDADRLVLCINHETPEVSRMFPGWAEAQRARRASEFVREHPEMVDVMRASVGVSVLEVERVADGWRLVADSPLNRRVTADTPIEFSGPAARHPWLGGTESLAGRCLGTLGNCAAGTTPWGTYLTAEENTNDFFGNAQTAEFEPILRRATERFGMQRTASGYRWELVDARFDHSQQPAESMKFGWIVEIDPLHPERPIAKRTALGRLRHEGATTVLGAGNRPVVYMGDDSAFEYFYKFVSDRVYTPGATEPPQDLLDVGTLYVAHLDDDGTGRWLPLVHDTTGPLSEANGFASQADVVLRCREAADLVGATPLDRPEDVAVHPHDGRIYLSCTQGLQRGRASARAGGRRFPGTDAANPRGPNPYGHILEFTEDEGDAAAERFRWDVFVLAGDPSQGLEPAVTGQLAPAAAYYAGVVDASGLAAFANPDNLGFDLAGNLWIVTDGTQPTANNNGCFVCATSGPDRGKVRQFMSGPVDAEISGCTFSPDGSTLFLTVQHPGGTSPIDAPSSHWPDGGDAPPRSSLIAIRSTDPARRFQT